jgi:hypothetical protein
LFISSCQHFDSFDLQGDFSGTERMQDHSTPSAIPPLVVLFFLIIFHDEPTLGFFLAIGFLILLSSLDLGKFFTRNLWNDDSLLGLPHGDQRPSGEINFVLKKARVGTARLQEFVATCAPFALGAILVAGLVGLVYFDSWSPPHPSTSVLPSAPEANSNPQSCISYPQSSLGCTFVALPEAPVPPGRYLSLETTGTNEPDRRLVFRYESLTIVVVKPPAQISAEDLETAIYWPPPKLTPLTASIEGDAKNSRAPYIITGDVEVECGPVVDYDIGNEKLTLENGSLSAAQITFASHSIRGPPYGGNGESRRKIYIVGSVKSYSGPSKHGHSQFDTELLELREGTKSSADVSLGATRQEETRFAEQKSQWSNSIRELATQHHVSEDYVRANIGSGGFYIPNPSRPNHTLDHKVAPTVVPHVKEERPSDHPSNHPAEHPAEHPSYHSAEHPGL